MQPPSTRPRNPSFGSGPTAKRPGWSVTALEAALTGRSHRSAEGKKRLTDVCERSRQILSRKGVPNIIIDQPRDLIGHVAGSGEMFVTRYGDCLKSFIEDGSFPCDTGVRTVAETPPLRGGGAN